MASCTGAFIKTGEPGTRKGNSTKGVSATSADVALYPNPLEYMIRKFGERNICCCAGTVLRSSDIFSLQAPLTEFDIIRICPNNHLAGGGGGKLETRFAPSSSRADHRRRRAATNRTLPDLL